jgi:adenylyltransferase/sulfurtransferase
MDRYSRQRLFPPIGDEGQERLLNSRVTLVGCGALGSHVAQHLARAGVGFIRLCDRDFVELDNLQRQVLYDEDDVSAHLPKVIAARQRLARINSGLEIDARIVDVTASQVLSLIDDVDLVIDGTDNFQTRFLLNDACVSRGRSWVYGGCVGSHGMVLTIIPGETPCFACVVPELPPPGSTPTCDTAGVLGPAVGVIAALEAGEALKLLTGHSEAIHHGLIRIDIWENRFDTFRVAREESCEVCGKGNYRYLESREGDSSSVLCGRNAVQITPARPAEIDFAELERRLSSHGTVKFNDYLLRFGVDGFEVTLFRDGRAVIKGTDEISRARALYARYIGN